MSVDKAMDEIEKIIYCLSKTVKKPKDELDVLIEKAIENTPMPKEKEYLLKEHTDICPKTGKPYETTKIYTPEMPLTSTYYQEICTSCGGVVKQTLIFTS